MQDPERAGISCEIVSLYAADVLILGNSYIGADLGSCVPHFDDFDIARYKKLALTLLPVENEPGILVAWYQIRQCTESGDQFNILF